MKDKETYTPSLSISNKYRKPKGAKIALYSLFILIMKQGGIPVGCVLPSFLVLVGVSAQPPTPVGRLLVPCIQTPLPLVM